MGGCVARSAGGIRTPTTRGAAAEGADYSPTGPHGSTSQAGDQRRSLDVGQSESGRENQTQGSNTSRNDNNVSTSFNHVIGSAEGNAATAATPGGGREESEVRSFESESSWTTSGDTREVEGEDQHLQHMSTSKLEEASRRRLSVSTVCAVPLKGERSVVGYTHSPLLNARRGHSAAHAFESAVNSPPRAVITQYSDPALQLVDQQLGAIKDVSVEMVLDLVPHAVSYFALFGAPSYQAQNGFWNKETELLTKGMEYQKLSEMGVGYSCKKGLKPESPNQDDFFILKIEDWSIYAVFDGHGPFGHEVSHFVHTALPFLIISDPQFETDTAAALRRGFRKVHQLLEAAAEQPDAYLDVKLSGTTATVLVQRDRTVYVAHVGDSRCVLARQTDNSRVTAVSLTRDHKPTMEAEKARIQEHGGEVRRLEGDVPYRVFVKNRMYPGLAMSRAIGDTVGSAVGVTADPDVRVIQLQEDDLFIVLSTDGVWEFISSQECVDYCIQKKQGEVQEAAELLAYESWNRWMEEEKTVVDDVTCLIIWL